MAVRIVRAPGGEIWTVHRRFRPWRLGWRSLPGEQAAPQGGRLPSLGFALALAAVVMLIAPDRVIGWILFGVLLLLGGLFVHVLIPGVIFLIEFAAFAIACGFSLVYRVLFRFPFRVQARPYVGESRTLVWSVVGFRRSDQFADEVATAIAKGEIEVHRTVP